MFTRCGICCVPAIFERQRGRWGSKISGCGQVAEAAVYFVSGCVQCEPCYQRPPRSRTVTPIQYELRQSVAAPGA
jgi:hypothetical protein